MNAIKKYQNMILFFVIAVLAIGGYFFFFDSSSEQQEGVSSQTVQQGTSAERADSNVNLENVEEGSEVLSLLLKIRSIELNKDLFENSTFNSLEDFSREIQPQPKGRKNPFEATDSAEDLESKAQEDE